jgi:hypothetical protein
MGNEPDMRRHEDMKLAFYAQKRVIARQMKYYATSPVMPLLDV